MTTNRTSSRIRRRTRTALAAATLLIVAAAAAGCAGAGRGADSGLSRPEVEAVVRTELAGVAALSSAPAAMTRTEIEQAIEEAVEGAADEAIEQAVDAAIDDAAGMARTEIEHAADAAVEQAVDAAIDDAAGMARTEIEHAIEEAVAAALAAQSPPEPGVTEAELAGAIRNALADAVPQEPAVTRADVEAISRRVVASVPPRSDPAAYTRFVVDNAISRYDSDGLDAVAAHYSRPESIDGQWYVFISAQPISARWSAVVVSPVVRQPSRRPSSSTATTVWVRLCASIPNVIMTESPFAGERCKDRSAGTTQWGRCHAPDLLKWGVRIVSPAARRDLATTARSGRASRQHPPIMH